MSRVATHIQVATGTVPTGGTAGQPNKNAPVPPQATGIVSMLNGVYVVQIVNPGASSALSQIQAAQAVASQAVNQGQLDASRVGLAAEIILSIL